MGGEWKPQHDKASGKTYYWHTETRKVQWALPAELKPPSQPRKKYKTSASTVSSHFFSSWAHKPSLPLNGYYMAGSSTLGCRCVVPVWRRANTEI